MDRQPAQNRYLPELDLVRTAATALILVYHFAAEFAAAGLLPGAAWPAFGAEVGIELFFLLSGASLCWGRGGRFDARRYYAGRALAIYPCFWVGFAALFLYGEVLHGNNAGIPKWKLVFSVLGLDGYLLPLGANFYKIGEWFLGCLLLIYLLFPLLRRLQNGRRRCLAATAALGAVWLAWPLCCPPPWDAAHTVLGRVFVFWCGMLAARVLRAPRRLGLLAALEGGGAVLALAALPWPGRWPQPAALCAALLVLALAGLGGPALDHWPRAAGAALRWCARQSYAVFLVHHVFLTLVAVPLARRLALPAAVWFLPYAAACLALGAVLVVVAKPVRFVLAKALGAAR